MRTLDHVEALAPEPEAFDRAWSERTLASITASTRPGPRGAWRRRATAAVAGGALVLGAGTAAMAVTGTGPFGSVEQVLGDLAQRSDTTAYGRGPVGDPVRVAAFDTPLGRFSVWTASLADGTFCTAEGFGTDPVAEDLDLGCGQVVLDHTDPDRVVPLDRPSRLGGFFTDGEAGPLVYGVAPYAEARWVRLEGSGVRRTLEVDPDSRGFGAALPGWDGGRTLRLTWLDARREVLGSAQWVTPVG